ncbi:hypothetical protein SAMN05216353_12249 [Halobacillus alkaliphilus]|uniref:Sporulation membrane protein YtrI C-terminal domain-containing protein n=1 Tax=Halobacillus alkaliphilus TaxID=396056 RepID=A0A1I2NZ84_9BACI|nr:sporulation membrane protein YtrI [Halobacillus alkaliphilus]SFG09182.1 hypothetical protein SAMN05216353_12249 [Halobacillus alkaliphilus]
MHIPPLYRKKEWRRFFAGMVFGAVIGYLFFLFIYGQLQEKYTEEHIELNSKLSEMEAKYEGMLNNQKEETENHPLTVVDISVSYTNAKKLEIDLLTQHQLTTLVKEQLTSVPGKDLTVVADQVDLMISTIENKNYVVDDFTYELKVAKLIASEVIQIHLEIKLVR